MSRKIAVGGPPLSQLAPQCACANGEGSRVSAMPPDAEYRRGRDEPEQRENNDSCDLWTACSDGNRAAPALSWCRSGDRICRTGDYDIDRSISPSRMHRARKYPVFTDSYGSATCFIIPLSEKAGNPSA